MARLHADVVVVAAGASQRFGSDKLDAEIAGRPLLAWTLEAIARSDLVDRIVLVTSRDRLTQLRDAPWLPAKVASVVGGGARRRDSVEAGIEAVADLTDGTGNADGERAVLVHDGARPLVTAELIASVIAAVAEHGAAVPVVPIVETVKRMGADGHVVETLDRSELAAAQTPQGATLARFQQALDAAAAGRAVDFTDEAAMLEACRIPVHAIPGDPTNLKVTLPTDLARAATILHERGGATTAVSAAVSVKVGYGADQHPFGPDTGLALGGVEFPRAPRLHGHSDGDVVLHAVADALLGAAGLGDLGRIFPADGSTPRGIASVELLSEVVRRVHATHLVVAGLDCTIVAGRPRLGPRLPEVGRRIAELLDVAPDHVNVKASTGNLDGMEGAGRGISATAVVTLIPGAGRGTPASTPSAPSRRSPS